MIITYFRSSSYNRWDFCPTCYFAEYALGITGPANKKADKGTITHKILELLACAKKAYQARPTQKTIDSNIGIGRIDIQRVMENDTAYIRQLAHKIFVRFSKKYSHHDWTERDEHDCYQWAWKALQMNNGTFDPRKSYIVDAEPYFDITLEHPAFEYNFTLKGQALQGQLHIKGTIDLIRKIDEETYEIVDWKTGRRFNWNTGEEKTAEKLQTDPQLMLYHYAAHKLYPQAKTILVTINYINDGGAFTVSFDTNAAMQQIQKLLYQRFRDIKRCAIPAKYASWKCKKLCHLGQTTFENTYVPPRFTQYGAAMTKCQQIHHDLKYHGIDYVTEKYMSPDYTIGFYQDPGL